MSDHRSKNVSDCDPEIASLLETLRANGWFAPKPGHWDGFWKAIRRGVEKQGYPPAPLILSAHWSTTAQRKHEQLIEQLEWARQHGRLATALDYLNGLEADAWSPLPHELWPSQSGGLQSWV